MGPCSSITSLITRTQVYLRLCFAVFACTRENLARVSEVVDVGYSKNAVKIPQVPQLWKTFHKLGPYSGSRELEMTSQFLLGNRFVKFPRNVNQRRIRIVGVN